MTKKKTTTFKECFDGSMKPMMILPIGTMKANDIARLNANGVCVVEAKDPAAVRFLDPIPVSAARTKIESAAIELSRKILTREFWTNEETRNSMTAAFVDLLVRGTSLDPQPSQAEKEMGAYDYARMEEVRKIAREDARKAREDATRETEARAAAETKEAEVTT